MASADVIIPEVTARIFECPFASLLDLGCGFGKWGYLTKIRLKTIKESAYILGCDVWLPDLRFCKQHGIYDDYVRCDVRAMPFKERSLDVVVACEVLEHLTKLEGQAFIRQAELIASRNLIISTPNGQWPQDALLGNEFQRHRSAWLSEELRESGFRVVGVGGLSTRARSKLLRFLGRGKGLPALGSVILALGGILSPRIPRLGNELVASKRTDRHIESPAVRLHSSLRDPSR